MKKILNSLPFKLLLGVAVGIVLGLVANEAVMNVVVTIKQVLGQIITFCVPLIVIGFIAPSITKLGSDVSRILGVGCAYRVLLEHWCRIVLDARWLRDHSQPVYRHVG